MDVLLLKELRQIKELLRENQLGNKQILTMEEASRFLDLSMSTLYHLTATKKIPHYKPTGGKIYLRRQDLESWLLQNKVSSDTDQTPGGKRLLSTKSKKFILN